MQPMQRYSSPTNQMTLDDKGSFVTFGDHEAAMARVPPSFAEHIKRHIAYEDRACVIITIFRDEAAISNSMFFGGFAGFDKSGNVQLMLDNLSTGDKGVESLSVDPTLFDTDATDVVVVSARQLKVEMERQREEKRAARIAREEAAELVELERLLTKYPQAVEFKKEN